MKICIVGGIFGKPPDYRATVTETPETILLRGLEQRGHAVEGRGHQGPFDFSSFDVVHVHHLSYGAVAAASDSSQTPFIFTRHFFGRPGIQRRGVLRYVVRRADAIVALSRTEAAWQIRHLSVPAARQHLIPNGIDAALFPYSHPKRPREAPWQLLYVGQLSPFKGVHVLLDALVEVTRRHPILLNLVHQAGTQEAALRTQARELGLAGVRFLGSRSPDELSKLFAQSDLFVLPSLRETLPSVITEAMLAGRPVVATDVGGIREQLHGFGHLVPPGDSTALAAGIIQVLECYSHYAAQSRDMSQSAAHHYSIPAMVDAHEQLYASLAQAGACTRHTIRRKLGTTAGQLVFPFSLRLVGGGR